MICFTSWFRTGNVLDSFLPKINLILGEEGEWALRKEGCYISTVLCIILGKRVRTLMMKGFHLLMTKDCNKDF